MISLGDSGQFQGWWWPAGIEDSQVPGTLHFDPKAGIQLSLIGALDTMVWEEQSDGSLTSHGQHRPLAAIHGVSHGKRVTVLEASVTQSTSTIGRGYADESQVISAATFVVGEHLDPEESLVRDCDFAVEDLAAFAPGSGLSFNFTDDRRERTIAWSRPPEYSGKLEDGDKLLLYRSAAVSTSQKRHHRVSAIEEEARAELCFGSRQTVEAAVGSVKAIQDLITFSAGTGCALLSLSLGLDEGKRRCDVVTRQRSTPEPQERPLRSDQMLVAANEIDLGRLLDGWWRVRRHCEQTVNVSLAGKYQDEHYLEQRTSAAMISAESLDKAIRPGKRILRDRLIGLIESLPKSAVDAFIPNRAAYVSGAVDTRNRILHGDRLDDFGIVYAVLSVTRCLVDLVLAAQIGLSADQLRAKAESLERIQRARRSAAASLI